MSAPAQEKPNSPSTADRLEPGSAAPRRGTRGWMTETGLVVVEWSKWGKHRLYVNTPDDRRVGWLDLVTGETTLEMPDLGMSFEEALQEGASFVEAVGYAPRRTLTDPVLDLADRRPGEHLETQIAAALDAGRELKPAQPGFQGKHAYSAMELGVLGERAVAEELDRLVDLDPRWAFLNSIPIGAHKADIDHLVVGPGGVFTVNSKHHHEGHVWVGEDALMVNHVWQHYVRESRAEAERASSLLSNASGVKVNATGMVVFVGLANLTIKAQPVDVHVLDQAELITFLMDQPRSLDEHAADVLLSSARLAGTWR